MSDFDDILNQPVEQPEAPSQEKNAAKSGMVADQGGQAEAGSLCHTEQDIHGIFGRPGRCAGVSRYPRAFDRYSARNALLIHDKCPGAKQIGNYRYWEKQGVEILKTEKNNPIIILEPGNTYRRKDGTMGQNYYAKEVYDISQTTARGRSSPRLHWTNAFY